MVGGEGAGLSVILDRSHLPFAGKCVRTGWTVSDMNKSRFSRDGVVLQGIMEFLDHRLAIGGDRFFRGGNEFAVFLKSEGERSCVEHANRNRVVVDFVAADFVVGAIRFDI